MVSRDDPLHAIDDASAREGRVQRGSSFNEKRDDVAKEQLDSIPLINDTPISFYANAAWEFAHGNETAGKQALAGGFRTFPPVKHVNFIEVFYDLGWLKRGKPAEPAAEEKPQ